MNGQINLGQLQPVKYFLSVAILIGLMFAFVAPDDTLAYGWLVHAVHWQLQTVVPMFFAIAIHFLLSRFGLLRQLNPWATLFITGLLTGLLFAPIGLISDLSLTSEVINESAGAALMDELIAIVPPIIVFWIAVNAPFILGWRVNKVAALGEEISGDSNQELLEDNKTNAAPAFIELIPEEKRGDIILLKSELHYLLVITEQGKSLILYSLKNAISELQNIEGIQPHRSYWVNRAYIVSINKNGREGEIIMDNGTKVPVSRARMREVSEQS